MAKGQNQSIQTAVGRVIRKIRNDKGMSQEKLALDSDLDRSFISLIESGHKQPTITTLFAIANALDIHPSEIIKLIESNNVP